MKRAKKESQEQPKKKRVRINKPSQQVEIEEDYQVSEEEYEKWLFEETLFEDVSIKQLIMVRGQLYELLLNEKLDQSEAYTEEFKNRYGGYSDELKKVKTDILQYVDEFIKNYKDPSLFIKEKGVKANSTLKFLRENIEGWQEYEDEYRKNEFTEAVINNLRDTEDAEYFTDYLHELLDKNDSEANKYIRKYINKLKEHCRQQENLALEFFPKYKNKNPFPYKWMLSTRELRKIFDPIKGSKKGKRFSALMNLLWENRMKYNEARSILLDMLPKFFEKEKAKCKSIKEKDQFPRLQRKYTDDSSSWVLVQPDVEKLARKLEVTPATIGHDLQRAVDSGALIRLMQIGNSPVVYVIGNGAGLHKENKGKKNEILKANTLRPLLKEAIKKKLIEVFKK